IWTVWRPDYLAEGLLKAVTALASVATAIGLVFLRPKVEKVVDAARQSQERRVELERANAELQALYSQVRQLDTARTRFFANVSHELRTPLALILGPAERMLDEPGLTTAQRRQLHSISRNSKSLLKQVNDLLDIARLEDGKMDAHYVCIDLATWFRRMASQFDLLAEQRRIAYRIEAPAGRLAVETDPDMLERVLVNLLANAFKFTPENGRITVRLEAKNSELHLSVADSGPGIPKSQQAAIFERFHQVDEGGDMSRHKPSGTGLGLAIVREYVQLHGGVVSVVSAAGRGATFTVRLPLRVPAAPDLDDEPFEREPFLLNALDSTLQGLEPQAPGEVEPVFAASAGRPVVLVAEDNREMRAFIGSTLSESYNVITAADGREGLASALALRPDLVVTDLMMPRMSGEQLVTALRARAAFDHVPVMLLTARDEDALRVKLLTSGAQDYLCKPFLPQELLARIDNLIALKRAGDTMRKELVSASSDIEGLAKELALKHQQLQTALDTAEVAREQAERASQAKSHFLGMVSHELRTPLSSIQLNAQLLSLSRAASAPERPDPRIERLTRAAGQMAALVESLLDYTRTEGEKVVLRLESTDLGALALQIVQAHADRTPPNVRLVLEPPPEGLQPLVTDPRLLRVVMSNLVSNALKFTPQGSVTVRLGSSDGWHSLEVVDTGVGIAQADLARVFLPFEQLEPTQHKSVPGVGLGLALVRQMVENLGGKVELASTLGSGSTFRVLLPDQRMPAPAHRLTSVPLGAS
ncbi:MAG: Two-component system sensor histidine kinase/response regulator, hybrid, partial [Polaromonas sp.]|nr:Two-component system sensor histidine kinase/response regulator, hybrid [Polaromonas sp.]